MAIAPAPSRGQAAGLWAVAVLMLLVYFPTARWLAHRWSLGVWFHPHGWAVPPIVAWLVYRGLQSVKGLPADSSRWGFAFVIPAILLQVLDALMGFELLSAVSLVLMLPGVALLFLGRQRTAAIWLGLFFLVFAIPIPLAVVHKILGVLRTVSAIGTEYVLRLLSDDVMRDGTLLVFEGQSVQIADACSGFATLMALTMATLLMLHLEKGSAARKLIVVALIFPVATAANVLRCVVLCALVVGFTSDVLNTWVHPMSGVAAFFIALVMIQGIIDLLLSRRSEETP
ncbi:MAG: exosortase/archaeosortase family protein [Planctomycetota bacterium]